MVGVPNLPIYFSKTFSVECHDAKSGQCFKQTWTDNMSKTTGPNITKTQRKTDCTKVTFIPDYDRFKMKTMNRAFVKFITKRTYEAAACSPKDVKVYLNDVQVPIHNLGDYAAMYGDSTPTYIKINKRWEIAVLPVNKDDTPTIPTFVNGICTSRGGNHVQHASQPLMKYLAELATKRVKGIKVRPRDVSSFAHVFVSSLIVNPAFDSQTKETLKTPVSEFGSKCDWKDSTSKNSKTPKSSQKVEEWALTKAGKQLSKRLEQRKLHISKLYDANKAGTKDAASCTCIFTEGDSALTMALSGMSIVGRDKFGAFPLKGKLLNVRDASPKPSSKIKRSKTYVKSSDSSHINPLSIPDMDTFLLWQIKTTMDPTLKDCSSTSSTTSGLPCYNKKISSKSFVLPSLKQNGEATTSGNTTASQNLKKPNKIKISQRMQPSNTIKDWVLVHQQKQKNISERLTNIGPLSPIQVHKTETH